MRYAHLKQDNKLSEYVQLTLDKMAWGGIYDQVGGGFAVILPISYGKCHTLKKCCTTTPNW